MTDAPNPDAEQTSNVTPPWGDDFDAARAWDLVQRLRREVVDEKTKTTTEREAREAAEAKAAEADPEGKIAAAEKRAADAERSLAVSKVLVEYPTLKDFEDLLTGETPEALKAQAERLSSLAKPAEGETKGKGKEKDEQTPPVDSTPKPDLTPGHGAPETPTFDPVAIAKSARR